MTRGNQRDGARAKAQSKQQEAAKKTPAGDREANKGLTPEERRQRDGEALRKKQEAKQTGTGDAAKK
jgi:4F5 protein related disordered region